jgi:hypothetical protein
MPKQRDPLFPVLLLLSVLFAVLFDVLSTAHGGLIAGLKDWQPLLAATVASLVALFGASIAYTTATATLEQTKDLETQRRSRKHSAVRSILPLAVVEVTEYAERSAYASCALVKDWPHAGPPHGTIPQNLTQPLPSETSNILKEFIEFSDPPLNVGIIQATITLMQIHSSRLGQLVKDNHDPSPSSSIKIITLTTIMGSIIDAASIYAAIGSVLPYARRQAEQLPTSLWWDAVKMHWEL